MDFHLSWLKNSCTGICPGNCENIGWIESIFCVNAHMIKIPSVPIYFINSTLVILSPWGNLLLENDFLHYFPRVQLKYSWNKLSSLYAVILQRIRFEPFWPIFPLWNFEKEKFPVSFIEEVSFDEETIFLISWKQTLSL